MLRMSCKTGLRCWNAYLGWRELLAVTGQLGLEGPEANPRNRCWRANTTWGKVNSSRNQLFTNGKRLVVQLPDDLQDEAVYGGGSKICGQKQNYFVPIGGAVFRENSREPYILGTPTIDVTKFFKMVHHSSRSKI